VAGWLRQAASRFHLASSIVAYNIRLRGAQLWALAGDMSVNLMDMDIPLGRMALSWVMIFKLPILLKAYSIAHVIVEVNNRLVRANRAQDI
jgi:hypothetical protein